VGLEKKKIPMQATRLRGAGGDQKRGGHSKVGNPNHWESTSPEPSVEAFEYNVARKRRMI